MAVPNSAQISAIGALHTNGVISISNTANPGPAAKISSTAYAPPQTLKNITLTIADNGNPRFTAVTFSEVDVS